MKRSFVSFILIVVFFSTTSAQQYHWKAGDIMNYRIHTIQYNDSVKNAEDDYIVQVKALKRVNNQYRFRCTFLSADMYAAGKYGYHFSSGDMNSLPVNSTSCFPIVSLLNKPFTITADQSGSHLDFDDALGLLDQSQQDWKISERLGKSFRRRFSALLSEVFSELFFTYPSETLQPDSRWLSADSSLLFKVEKMTKSSVFIVSKAGPKKANWEGKGEYVLNGRSGILMESTKTDSGFVLMIGKSDKEEGEKALSKRVTEVNLLEELPNLPTVNRDGFRTRILMSLFSDSLKTGSAYDSTKVHRFLAANDGAYKKDSAYIVNKLFLLQQSNDYKLYDRQLSVTPNRLIRNLPNHLFNKLEDVYSENIDSAIAIIRLFYDTELFNTWVQDAFAQSFRKPELSSERRKRADSLLMLLLKEQDSSYYYTFKPLALWSASQKTEDAVKLRGIVKAFEKMDHHELWYGRSARYGMLIYQQLQGAGLNALADTLLNEVITRLTQDQSDSLQNESMKKAIGERKFVHKNLLAQAYYLKYTEQRDDKKKALQYLAQAALYSPANNGEMAYQSFYDQALLHAKKGYRADFAKVLAAEGGTEAALKILTGTLQSNPLMIDEVRSMYDSLKADSTFPFFFYDELVKGWKKAANFSLKDLQGKNVSLADYTGKWLLLDFWGTWCSPCREEMPHVQKFYDQILGNKIQGISLLTVASYDMPDKVKAYFAAHHYTLPTVMADDSIIKHYEIPGYPAKILISPEGTWLPIRFGEDWQGIVKKYTDLYQEYTATSPQKQHFHAGKLD